MTFNLPTVQKLLSHYQALQGHSDRAITCEIVPGLKHGGEDAWATVEHDADPGTPLHVRVRDLARTPIPGVKDPWTQLKITMSHELWHPDVTAALAARTVEAEEKLVEKFAQAIVRAEAQGAPDARIMARSIQMALARGPATLRARVAKISARAATRARGEQQPMMNPETVKKLVDAIESGDAAAMTEIGKALLVEAASGQTPDAAPAAPAGDPLLDAPPDVDMRPADMPPGDDEKDKGADAARKARMAMQDEAKLRARRVAATEDIEASATIHRQSTLRARIHEARTVDGLTIAPEAEKLIVAAPSIAEGEIRLTLARGSAGQTVQRARAVDPVTGKPVVAETVKSEEGALLEGLGSSDLVTYHNMKASNPRQAKMYAEQAQAVRARLVKGAAS